MLRKSLDAFARLDLAASAEVVRRDEHVDDEFRGILRQLITFMMEDPRTISDSIEILFIAKAIERIGDHAKNMSEYVVYMVKGKDVRHVTLEEIERESHGLETDAIRSGARSLTRIAVSAEPARVLRQNDRNGDVSTSPRSISDRIRSGSRSGASSTTRSIPSIPCASRCGSAPA